MRALLGVLAVLLIAPALTGCLAGGDQPLESQSRPDQVPLPDPVRILEDPAGDARPWDGLWARQVAAVMCEQATDGPVRETCLTATDAASQDAGAGGPPELDILGVTFQETPQALVIDLELAKVDPSFSEVLPLAGGQLEYGICWDTAERSCNVNPGGSSELRWPQNPFVIYRMTEEGPDAFLEQFLIEDPACGGLGACRAGIPVELIAGSPGVVRFTVPRAAMEVDAAGSALEGIHAYTAWLPGPLSPSLRVSGGGLEGAFAPGVVTAAVADITAKAEPFAFRTPQAPAPAPDPGPHVVADRIDEPMVGPPEGDILDLTVVEAPGSITFVTRLAEVREEPFDHEFFLGMQIQGGGALAVIRDAVGGQAETAARACPPGGCDRALAVPVDLDVATGVPGWLNFTVPRSDPFRPVAGDRFSEVTVRIRAVTTNGTGAGPMALEVVEDRSWDILNLPLLPPLAYDPPGPESGSLAAAGLAPDDVGDVAVNPSIPAQDRANYDVRLVEAAAVAPGTVGLTVALEQLTAAPVPTGYDAVVYAAAVQTEEDTVMAYFVKPRNGPGEAYCAQDTLAFASEPTDPTVAIGTPIQAVVNAVADDAGGRSQASGGSITMLAPASCFGVAPDAPLEVQRMAGGTYLLREVPNLENRVDTVDRSEDSEAFVVEPLSAATAQPAVWQEPFGIGNFWDITGIVLAVLTVAATAFVVLRRRRAMRRYLDEIARIEDRHADDPAARAEALVALRERLRQDLIKHRISENHFPIVADRLRARLTSARINSLGEAFFELPGSLSRRIERLLDDGYLSREDHRGLVPMVERAAVEPDTRDRITHHLEAWVREDARGA